MKYLRSVSIALFLLHVSGIRANIADSVKELDTGIQPSFAKPVSVSIQRGDSTVITLEAKAAKPGARFILRSKPQRGEISPVRVIGPGFAQVEYSHRRDESGDRDSFDYAVQNPGASVSARATVSIAISDRPARLEITKVPSFGTVPVGDTRVQHVVIKNSGDVTFAGKLSASAPWSVLLESSDVAIPAGSELLLSLAFTPDEDVSFTGKLAASGSVEASWPLSGKGARYLEVTPSRLALDYRSADGSRSSEVIVKNNSEEPIQLTAAMPSLIAPIPALTLQPRERRHITVSANSSISQGGKGDVVFRAGNETAVVSVQVGALPANVVIEDSAGIRIQNEVDSVVRVFRNVGGSRSVVRLKGPDWLSVNPEQFSLEANQLQEVEFSAARHADVPVEGFLDILSDSEPKSIPVHLDVMKPRQRVVPRREAIRTESRMRDVDLSSLNRERLILFKVEGSPSRVSILFRDPYPAPRTYRVERERLTSLSEVYRRRVAAEGTPTSFSTQDTDRRLELAARYEATRSNDRLVKSWQEIEPVQIERLHDGLLRLSYSPQRKNGIESIRISSVTAQGKISPATTFVRIPIVRISSPLEQAHIAGVIVLAVPAIAICVLVLKRIVRRPPRGI